MRKNRICFLVFRLSEFSEYKSGAPSDIILIEAVEVIFGWACIRKTPVIGAANTPGTENTVAPLRQNTVVPASIALWTTVFCLLQLMDGATVFSAPGCLQFTSSCKI